MGAPLEYRLQPGEPRAGRRFLARMNYRRNAQGRKRGSSGISRPYGSD